MRKLTLLLLLLVFAASMAMVVGHGFVDGRL
jgi:hypothetical protein